MCQALEEVRVELGYTDTFLQASALTAPSVWSSDKRRLQRYWPLSQERFQVYPGLDFIIKDLLYPPKPAFFVFLLL